MSLLAAFIAARDSSTWGQHSQCEQGDTRRHYNPGQHTHTYTYLLLDTLWAQCLAKGLLEGVGLGGNNVPEGSHVSYPCTKC